MGKLVDVVGIALVLATLVGIITLFAKHATVGGEPLVHDVVAMVAAMPVIAAAFGAVWVIFAGRFNATN